VEKKQVTLIRGIYIYIVVQRKKRKRKKTQNELCRNYFSFVLIIKKEVPEEILEIMNKNFNMYFAKNKQMVGRTTKNIIISFLLCASIYIYIYMYTCIYARSCSLLLCVSFSFSFSFSYSLLFWSCSCR
jgi:hypothetical protein